MSWFNRRPKNRRLGREQHVLDVKLRSDQVRASRLRFAAIGLVLLISTLAGFFLLWHAGGWAMDFFVYENPAFSIEKIEARTDGVIPVAQLRRWTGVRLGQNLLALDLARVKRDLEMAPAVRSVVLERVMPHTLRVRVTEREAIARISVLRLKPDGSSEPSFVRVDRDGFVMTQPDAARGTNDNLPAICGLNLDEVVPGKKIDSAQVRAALSLIQAFDHSPMAGLADLQQIDVSAPEILQVTTGASGKIVFALDNSAQQLRRWRDIHDHARDLGKAVVTLDLSVPGNIPAVLTNLVAEALPPPAAPKTINPQPTKRRNV